MCVKGQPSFSVEGNYIVARVLGGVRHWKPSLEASLHSTVELEAAAKAPGREEISGQC